MTDVVAKRVLVVHAVSAIVTARAAVHDGLLACAALLGRAARPRLQRRYATVLAVACPFAFALGPRVYPRCVVEVLLPHLEVDPPCAPALDGSEPSPPGAAPP